MDPESPGPSGQDDKGQDDKVMQVRFSITCHSKLDLESIFLLYLTWILNRVQDDKVVQDGKGMQV